MAEQHKWHLSGDYFENCNCNSTRLSRYDALH